VNGVLTAIPIVWYNNAYNLGIRLYSIPVEDVVYSMAMLLLTITVYELLKQKHFRVLQSR
jgi:lycopene cyclase domain-containing protein